MLFDNPTKHLIQSGWNNGKQTDEFGFVLLPEIQETGLFKWKVFSIIDPWFLNSLFFSYLIYVRHNSFTLDVFTKFVKKTNHTRLWDTELVSYSSRVTYRICLCSLEHFLGIYAFRLLYGCTTWTLTKRLEKKLDGNYTRMLRAILNKSWRQHPTRHQLYGHLPPITKTIQVRRTRHAGHCWRSRDELIRDVLLWTPAYGRAKAGRPARTYIQQLCEDTGCCPEDLPRAMNDREEWRERVRDICATSATWWWWWGLPHMAWSLRLSHS